MTVVTIQKKKAKNCKMSNFVNAAESPLSHPLQAHKKALSHIKRVSTPDHDDQSITEEVRYSSEEEEDEQSNIQRQILAELNRVNDRLDDVETQVAGCSKDKNIPVRKGHKLSNQKYFNLYIKDRSSTQESENSESLDSESVIPMLSSIRTLKSIQRQIDHTVANLEKHQRKQIKLNLNQKGDRLMLTFQIKLLGHMNIFSGMSRSKEFLMTKLTCVSLFKILSQQFVKCREKCFCTCVT